MIVVCIFARQNWQICTEMAQVSSFENTYLNLTKLKKILQFMIWITNLMIQIFLALPKITKKWFVMQIMIPFCTVTM